MARQPEAPRTFREEWRKTREQQRVQGAASRLIRSGIQVIAEGISEVIGTLQSQGFVADTTGWRATPDELEVNSLKVRNGIIGDDALANPTAFGFGGNSAQNFSIGTSAAAKASIGIPVPAGFTRALVHVTVNASAQNTASVYDYLYVSASITLPGGALGGSGGDAMDGIAAGEWGNAGASAAGSYTGLGSGSIVVACNARCGSGWTAQSANIANVDATVTFLR